MLGMVIHKLNSALNAAPGGPRFFDLRTRRDDTEVPCGQSEKPTSPELHGRQLGWIWWR